MFINSTGIEDNIIPCAECGKEMLVLHTHGNTPGILYATWHCNECVKHGTGNDVSEYPFAELNADAPEMELQADRVLDALFALVKIVDE